jgi:hypothetical protein
LSDTGLFPGISLFVLLCVIGCVALLGTRRHQEELPMQLQLFLVAFALRFLLSIAIYQFGLVAVFGDEDASGWSGGAALREQWVKQGTTPLDLPFVLAGAFEGQHAGYGYLLGVFFYLTDSPYRLPAAALNGFFGALTVIFAYRIARTLFSPWVANRVGWWACVFPSLLIWSALTVKEPVVIFLETVALYGCVRLREGGLSLPHLFVCAVTVVLLLPFRFYAAYIVGAAVVLSLVAPAIFQPGRAGAGLAMLALVVPLVLGTGLFARHEAKFEQFNLERVEQFRTNVASGGRKWGGASGVKTSYDMQTPEGFGMGTAVGAAHLMLAPFPWQLGGASLRMLLSLPELLFWWWLFFAGVIPGTLHVIRQRLGEFAPALLLILGFGLLYSMLFGNVGLVFRQRAQLLPWLLILGAVGLEQRALWRLAADQVGAARAKVAEAYR